MELWEPCPAPSYDSIKSGVTYKEFQSEAIVRGLDEEPFRSTSSVDDTENLTYLADEAISHVVRDEETTA